MPPDCSKIIIDEARENRTAMMLPEIFGTYSRMMEIKSIPGNMLSTRSREPARKRAGCGHWTQQERPAEVNKFLIDWLKNLS